MELTQFEKTGTNEAKLTVKVTAEEFGRAVDEAIREKGKTLTVPGFRKGKAPRALLEKTFSRAYFYQDAVNNTYGEAYDKAVEKADIVPVDRADIELVDCSEDGYTFTATVTVKPEVKVKNYKGIKVNKTVRTVSDTEIDNEINRMLERNARILTVEDRPAQLGDQAERNARILTVEDRPAQLGDQAEIDYEGFKDGVPFEGGKGEHYPLELGSGQFIPGFEDQVCGHNVGDEFDVNVSFPEDYSVDELKGAPVVFKCKLHSIKCKELPEADDDFAKDVSEFDTLAELKDDIKKKLEEKNEEAATSEIEEQLADVIIENTTVEVPECMYEARIEDMVSDFENRLARSGLTLDEYLKYTGANKEDFLKGFRPQAERQVKIRLALEAVAQAENITVTAEEMDEEYKMLAERYDMPEEQIRSIAPVASLSEDLAVEKAMKFVREQAKVTEVKPGEAPKKKRASKKAEEAPAEEQPAEEAPKKKRTTKKKVEETPVEGQPAEEAPKKKRTTKKKVEEAPVEEKPAEEAPAKKVTRKKKADDFDPSVD